MSITRTPLDGAVARSVGLIPRQRSRSGTEDVRAVPRRTPDFADTAPPPAREAHLTALWSDLVAAVLAATSVAAVLRLPVTPVVLASAVWFAVLAGSGRYHRDPLGASTTTELARLGVMLAKAAVLVTAASALSLPATGLADLLVLMLAMAAATATATLVSRPPAARVVLVGHPRDVRARLADLHGAGRHRVVAVCLTRRPTASFGPIPVYAGVGTTTSALVRHRAGALVVLPGRHLDAGSVRRLQWAAADAGAVVYVDTSLIDVHPSRTAVVSGHGVDLLRVAAPSLSGPRRWVVDVAGRLAAAALLLVLAPVLLVLAVLIRLDSPGPALFRQTRVGLRGRHFEMLKFRSMAVSAESDRTALVACNEADGVLFKIQRDPRVTRVGAVIRRWSLDELPQLVNVVRGDMALVGPRPALPGEVARYDADPHRRLAVKPGLTGLWQVSGRSDLSWDESVRLDLRYVDNWSPGADLSILLRTTGAVLGHRGAY